MANKKGSRQLTWTDRISIEALKKAGHSVIEIAEQLGVHRSTIYNELKRGEYMHRNSDYTETLSYSPNKAQMKAEENLKANEIIFKLPDHTDEAVVAALDRLERKWGADMFKRVFKTITVDNGSEFADAEGLQRSIINEGEKRTKVYYCHPYSSWERGTNEETNKMIRRKIPKGTNFDDRTEEEVESIEDWINGYPRKIHGYHSAGELFEEEVKQLA